MPRLVSGNIYFKLLRLLSNSHDPWIGIRVCQRDAALVSSLVGASIRWPYVTAPTNKKRLAIRELWEVADALEERVPSFAPRMGVVEESSARESSVPLRFKFYSVWLNGNKPQLRRLIS